MDDTISTIAHELAEAAVDPYPPFGYSSVTGQENGDVCAWKYKKKKRSLVTGLTHNMVGKSRRKFYIQVRRRRPSISVDTDQVRR